MDSGFTADPYGSCAGRVSLGVFAVRFLSVFFHFPCPERRPSVLVGVRRHLRRTQNTWTQISSAASARVANSILSPFVALKLHSKAYSVQRALAPWTWKSTPHRCTDSFHGAPREVEARFGVSADKYMIFNAGKDFFHIRVSPLPCAPYYQLALARTNKSIANRSS